MLKKFKNKLVTEFFTVYKAKGRYIKLSSTTSSLKRKLKALWNAFLWPTANLLFWKKGA